MQGLLAGLLVLSVTYFGGKGLLQRFFFRTGYVYAKRQNVQKNFRNMSHKISWVHLIIKC